MSPQRWQQVRGILADVLEHPAAERRDFLDAACAGDAEMRREVEELAAFEPELGELFERPAAVVAGLGPEDEKGRDEDARLAPGTVLAGRYRVGDLLGRGGMGRVYRADDLALDVSVALKPLPAGHEDDPGPRRRLREEVRLARRVTHVNVCRIYDLEEDGGRLFLTMESIPGEDLAALVRRVGRLPAERVAELGAEIAAGLAAAHELGILHRDLKPSNVLLDEHGRAKVVDFGIAAMAGAGATSRPRD